MYGKGISFTLLVEMSIGVATVENSMEVFKKNKIKIELPYDQAVPFLGIYTQNKDKNT